MANKVKEISINTVEKCMADELKNEPVTVEWRGQDLVIKRRLGVSDLIRLVDEVTRNCFTDDGAYLPEAYAFILKHCMISYYTNIRLPKDVERRYEVVNAVYKDIAQTVLSVIDKDQFDEMMEAIEKKVSALADARTQSALAEIEKAGAVLRELGQRMSELFGGVSPEEVQGIAQALGNGSVDESKLMDAYLRAQEPAGEQKTEDTEASQ